MTRPTGRTRVLVVDDSAIAREALTLAIEAEGDLHVVATAADGGAAVQIAERERPDVITMDVQMPGAGGLAAIEEIMARAPAPIVVVTALPSSGNDLAFEAMRRGALDLAPKPGSKADEAALRALVRRVAGLPVVRHVNALRAARQAAPPPARSSPDTTAKPVVGVAASAGGPAALVTLLAALPAGLPTALAVVQHLPVGFHGTFATFLAGRTGREVVTVTPARREPLRSGCIYLPTDDHHLVAASPTTFAATAEPPVGGHRPSADRLFATLATHHGARAVGVILTGIGDDGARGLLALRREGAVTLGQDQASSAVWGMPQAAAALGAVAQTVGLDQMATAIVAAVRGEVG